jgi:adenylate cyclase class 2
MPGMAVSHRNLELKAHYTDLAAARKPLQLLELQDGGREIQTDTYFRVVGGRLKLREMESGAAVLIGYHRPDVMGARWSDYHLVPVPQPAAMKALLADLLGIRGVVRKSRTILFWENVRIHLDEVDGLGTFVEFEAVLKCPGDADSAQSRLDELCRLLDISPASCLAGSYADLLGP